MEKISFRKWLDSLEETATSTASVATFARPAMPTQRRGTMGLGLGDMPGHQDKKRSKKRKKKKRS